jgi:hypothetical protein
VFRRSLVYTPGSEESNVRSDGCARGGLKSNPDSGQVVDQLLLITWACAHMFDTNADVNALWEC